MCVSHSLSLSPGMDGWTDEGSDGRPRQREECSKDHRLWARSPAAAVANCIGRVARTRVCAELALLPEQSGQCTVDKCR